MTREEVKELGSRRPDAKDELWIKAFAEFNENRDIKRYPRELRLSCMKCYFDIKNYHRKLHDA